jgi:rRNA maturation protein Rpf1
MIFISIEIKINIDINNDELLIIIWEHNKKEKSLVVVHSNIEPKFYLKKLAMNKGNITICFGKENQCIIII